MRKGLVLMLALAVGAGAAVVNSVPAQAENGQVAAGIIGGLAVGTLFGAAMAQPRYYAPAPVYVAPPPACYWMRGQPIWDEYRGVWYRPRIQVCD